MYEFDVVIVEDESGGYVGFVPALPGCHTQGDSVGELLDNAKEAVELYLETLTEEEKRELLRQRVVGLQKVKALAQRHAVRLPEAAEDPSEGASRLFAGRVHI